jgi:hypothetical protein
LVGTLRVDPARKVAERAAFGALDASGISVGTGETVRIRMLLDGRAALVMVVVVVMPKMLVGASGAAALAATASLAC